MNVHEILVILKYPDVVVRVHSNRWNGIGESGEKNLGMLNKIRIGSLIVYLVRNLNIFVHVFLVRTMAMPNEVCKQSVSSKKHWVLSFGACMWVTSY